MSLLLPYQSSLQLCVPLPLYVPQVGRSTSGSFFFFFVISLLFCFSSLLSPLPQPATYTMPLFLPYSLLVLSSLCPYPSVYSSLSNPTTITPINPTLSLAHMPNDFPPPRFFFSFFPFFPFLLSPLPTQPPPANPSLIVFFYCFSSSSSFFFFAGSSSFFLFMFFHFSGQPFDLSLFLSSFFSALLSHISHRPLPFSFSISLPSLCLSLSGHTQAQPPPLLTFHASDCTTPHNKFTLRWVKILQ